MTQGENGVLADCVPAPSSSRCRPVGPSAIRELAGRIPTGVGCADAPVLGSVGEARNGSLTIFVGGEEDVVRTIEPVLSVLGRMLHVGALGSGERQRSSSETPRCSPSCARSVKRSRSVRDSG